MKQILLSTMTIFLLSGCFGDPVDSKSNESESDLEEKNLNHGGEGSINDQFTIGNGIFGTKSSGTTYYDFKVEKGSENSCGLIIYDSTEFEKDVNLETASGYATVKKNELYQIYNSLNDGTYRLTSKEANKEDRFGLYSNCISSTYNYTLINLTESTSPYEFNQYHKIYQVNLTSKQNIKIDGMNNVEEYILLDKDFSIIQERTTQNKYDVDLEAGKYYLLFQGTKDSATKTSFIYEITDN